MAVLMLPADDAIANAAALELACTELSAIPVLCRRRRLGGYAAALLCGGVASPARVASVKP